MQTLLRYLRIATSGNTIRTVNSFSKYECSWSLSEARNCTHQHTDSTKISVPGWDWTYNALGSILLSQRIIIILSAHYIKQIAKSITAASFAPDFFELYIFFAKYFKCNTSSFEILLNLKLTQFSKIQKLIVLL